MPAQRRVSTIGVPRAEDVLGESAADLRVRLGLSRRSGGYDAVSARECDAVLDLLGLDSTHASLQYVQQKRDCVAEALDSHPVLVRTAFAAAAYDGGASEHPAFAKLGAALPYASDPDVSLSAVPSGMPGVDGGDLVFDQSSGVFYL